MLWWGIEEEIVKRVTLVTNDSGGTSDETADGIDVFLRKLDIKTHRFMLTGQHGDAGSGGTGNSLMKGLPNRNRIDTINEHLSSTCNNHGINLLLSVPTIICFGTGGLEKRNVSNIFILCGT